MASQRPTSSQPTSSSQNQTLFSPEETYSDAVAKKVYDALTTNQRNQMVATITRFFLFSQSKGLPIKKKDIIEKAMPNHARAFPLIISDANQRLNDVFGLKLVEFTKGSIKYYVMHNNLDIEYEIYDQFVEIELIEKSKFSFLTVILALIFMNQRLIPEDELWDFLMTLGLSSSDAVHPLLGNVTALLNDYIKAMYIEKIKISNQDGVIFQYGWGVRAHLEFSPRGIIEFVAKVHNDPPEKWYKVYKYLLVMPDKKSLPTVSGEVMDITATTTS